MHAKNEQKQNQNPWYSVLTNCGWQAILADLIVQEQLEEEKQI